jgi:hypothetical protein
MGGVSLEMSNEYLGIIAIAMMLIAASFSSHALAAKDAADVKQKPKTITPPRTPNENCQGASCAIKVKTHDKDNTNNNDNNPDVVRHNDRPDKDCATNPLLGKCSADCNTDKSFCECPRGFVMNENDHCAVEKCPRGFEQRSDDETGTCFPTKALLKNHPHAKPMTKTTIKVVNSAIASAAASASTELTIPITGFNATFFTSTLPYCWYTVNVPPCYDSLTGSVVP